MAQKGVDYVKRYSRFKKRSEPLTLSQTRNFANCDNGWRLIFSHIFSSRKLLERKKKKKKKRKICLSTMKVFKCSRQLEKSFSPSRKDWTQPNAKYKSFPRGLRTVAVLVLFKHFPLPLFSAPSFCPSFAIWMFPSSSILYYFFVLACNFAVLAFIRVALNNACPVQQVTQIRHVLDTCSLRTRASIAVLNFPRRFLKKLFLDNLLRIKRIKPLR